MGAFIYINGYPGVGKLTVAKELSKLLPKAYLVSNHDLIDPIAAICERTAPEYQPLRRALRQQRLIGISNRPYTREETHIFTDQQSSSELGSSTAKEYQAAAKSAGCPFVSVILTCEAGENFKRAVDPGRGNGKNTKLTDIDVVRTIREQEDIFHFGGEFEMELDVTDLSPEEASRRVYHHVCRVCMIPSPQRQQSDGVTGTSCVDEQ